MSDDMPPLHPNCKCEISAVPPPSWLVVLDRNRYEYAIVAVDNGGQLHVAVALRAQFANALVHVMSEGHSEHASHAIIARMNEHFTNRARVLLAPGNEVEIAGLGIAGTLSAKQMFEKLRLAAGLPSTE